MLNDHWMAVSQHLVLNLKKKHSSEMKMDWLCCLNNACTSLLGFLARKSFKNF